MGIINDIFIASETDLIKLTVFDSPLDFFPGIDASGINKVKIAMLSNIVGNVKFDEALNEQPLIKTISEQGPWISRIPDRLRDMLASLANQDLQKVAVKWGKTKEFAADGWKHKDIAMLLEKLAHLARQAQPDGKSLFLWTSL
jgi:hypothetical protein